MKLAIATATHFGAAIISLLETVGYDDSSATYADGTEDFVLVNTKKRTYKDSNGAGANGRPVYNPATQWALIEGLLNGETPAAVTGSQAYAAATATTITRTTTGANGETIAVGDTVTAVNNRRTKEKFRLQPGFNYTVDRITAKGNIGLAGLPNDEYIKGRFTKVATAAAVAPAATATALPTPPAAVPMDAAGNPLAIGDTVLVVAPEGKKALFNLRPNGVATITRITPKGALGFDFDQDNEFLAKRWQKVTLSTVPPVPASGSLVVNTKTRRDGRFALPLGKALTFRGLTTSGKVILDGYTADQYVQSRFQAVTPVTAR